MIKKFKQFAMKNAVLSLYKSNVTSQWGEDGIISEIFNRIGPGGKFCVEFGAWDGKHYSNAWNLWHEKNWSALLIEADKKKAYDLARTVVKFSKVATVCAFVEPVGENSVGNIVEKVAPGRTVDLLSIDIDGNDYYILESLSLRPRVIVIEYNPTIPPSLSLVQKKGEYLGASARAITDLAHEKGYALVALTETNLFFVQKDEFVKLGFTEPLLEEIFIPSNLTYIITSYDGVTFTTKNPTYANLNRENTKRRYFATPHNLFPVLVRSKKEGFLKRAWRSTKIIIKKTPVHQWYLTAKTKLQRTHNIFRHKQKQSILNYYRRRFGMETLIETGTYEGDMVFAMRNRFEKIYSIELGNELATRAKQRFSTHQHIKILQGDSSVVLPKILTDINTRALFWLDGHYSGGITAKGSSHTPIISELDAILSRDVKGDVILIDDARCFNGEKDYPTLESIKKFINEKNNTLSIIIKSDIIRIY